MRPPAFWDADAPRSSARLTRALLSPLGALYAMATARRIARTTPAPAPAPVICIGNLTLGGTGKTPVAIAVIEAARASGLSPAGLSRGWGGRLKGPMRVDPRSQSAREVGDEPLLIARAGPAYIDPGRVEGARLAVREGADLIVMDDGHQNPKLEKTCSIVVVDGAAGWGAGKVFPAGPLREPVKAGLARADAVVVMVRDAEDTPRYRALGLADIEIPVLKAWLEPKAPPPPGKLLAFAGIGRPQKFFDALKAAGAELAETAGFPDHHPYTRAEIDQLADLAAAHGARLITTEKDWVRLPGGVQGAVTAWPVRARFDQPARLTALIQDAVDAHRGRG
ncbi:MAG: tetraacyldisaccharide 4'-kinase [Oceanicaulis sp.]